MIIHSSSLSLYAFLWILSVTYLSLVPSFMIHVHVNAEETLYYGIEPLPGHSESNSGHTKDNSEGLYADAIIEDHDEEESPQENDTSFSSSEDEESLQELNTIYESSREFLPEDITPHYSSNKEFDTAYDPSKHDTSPRDSSNQEFDTPYEPSTHDHIQESYPDGTSPNFLPVENFDAAHETSTLDQIQESYPDDTSPNFLPVENFDPAHDTLTHDHIQESSPDDTNPDNSSQKQFFKHNNSEESFPDDTNPDFLPREKIDTAYETSTHGHIGEYIPNDVDPDLSSNHAENVEKSFQEPDKAHESSGNEPKYDHIEENEISHHHSSLHDPVTEGIPKITQNVDNSQIFSNSTDDYDPMPDDYDPVPEVPNNAAPEDAPLQVDTVPANKRKCSIPQPWNLPVDPTMIASYPGSGAKLTWKLIRAVSGYMTSDDAVDVNGLSKAGEVIAIKTHYPARGSNPELFAPYENIPRSVLLIRNPFNAIPSFHSYIYEQSLQLTGHSVRAPVNKWIAWRNKHFDTELDYWVRHTRFWMNHHPPQQHLILPYDFLIKPEYGPTELSKLRRFLENDGRVEMRTPAADVPCIWDYIVMKREDQGTKVGSMRTGGPTVWPYTPGQIEKMISTLKELKEEFPGQLGQLMELYIYHIKDTISNSTTDNKRR